MDSSVFGCAFGTILTVLAVFAVLGATFGLWKAVEIIFWVMVFLYAVKAS